MTVYDRHHQLASTVATRTWEVIDRPTVDEDDARQEGILTLLNLEKRESFLELDHDSQRRYLTTCIRHAVFRMTRKASTLFTLVDEDLVLSRPAVLPVDLYSLVEQATEPSIREYLQCRLLDRFSRDASRRALGWTRARTEDVHQKAAQYVMGQLEGQGDL